MRHRTASRPAARPCSLSPEAGSLTPGDRDERVRSAVAAPCGNELIVGCARARRIARGGSRARELQSGGLEQQARRAILPVAKNGFELGGALGRLLEARIGQAAEV